MTNYLQVLRTYIGYGGSLVRRDVEEVVRIYARAEP
jgi:hypothetical protein